MGWPKRAGPAAEAIPVDTANGTVRCDKEAHVYIEQLKMSVWALILPKTPKLLSLGQLCKEDGFSFVWGAANETPKLIFREETTLWLSKSTGTSHCFRVLGALCPGGTSSKSSVTCVALSGGASDGSAVAGPRVGLSISQGGGFLF